MTEARLLSGDVRLRELQIAAGVTAQPGFQTSVDTVFEVDPAQIDDLTIEMWAERGDLRLPATRTDQARLAPANAEQWRAAARGSCWNRARAAPRAIP